MAKTLYEEGWHCLRANDYRQASAFFERCLSSEPSHVPALTGLAQVRHLTGHVRSALTAYRQALSLSPGNPAILSGMANCYRAEGDVEKAVAYYKRALKADPDDAVAMYNLTLVHEYGLKSPLTRKLQKLHACGSCTGQSRALVCFALARIHEYCGDLEGAFRYYAQANAARFPLARYDEGRCVALFEELEATFTGELFRRLEGPCRMEASPIFVLGMPRSGSSLVEQILATHSGVFGAGETSILPWIVETLVPGRWGFRFPRVVAWMDEWAFPDLADFYLRQLSAYCPDKGVCIVDKTPSNFFLVGLIHMLFPLAPIVHCVRDPMDTCWSIFRQCFPGSAHGYCYDQGALGRYYRRYQRLMDHWNTVLPSRIHDVRYEELVERPEKTVRALLDYCRLPWEEKCLAFHRTKRVVNTASTLEVRRPLFKTSIKSWLPVADELAPLRAALEAG